MFKCIGQAEGLQDMIDDYINNNLEQIVLDHMEEVRTYIKAFDDYQKEKRKEEEQ